MRFFLRLTIIFLITLFISAPDRAAAQAPLTASLYPAPVILDDSISSMTIGPNSFLTRDAAGNLSYAALIKGHISGERRGILNGRSTLSLGTKSVPHWLVFSVINNSKDQSRWVVALGTHGNGSFGGFEKGFAYSETSKNYLFYALPDATGAFPKVRTLPYGGTGIPLSLAPGQQTLIALYLVPEGGGPTTIHPTIMTEQIFLKQKSSLTGMQSLIPLTILLGIGFLFGLIILKKSYLSFAFIPYLLSQGLLYGYQSGQIILPWSYAAEVTLLLFGLAMLLAIIISKIFLQVSNENSALNKLMISLMMSIIMLPCIALISAGEQSLARPILLALGPTLTLVILVLISAGQWLAGKSQAGLYTMSWAILLLGASLTMASVMGVLPDNIILVSAYWSGLIIQTILFAGIMTLRALSDDAESQEIRKNSSSDAENMTIIKDVKDSAENARLLRVIEHERQMLQDLRDREIQQNEDMRRAKEDADLANRAKSAFLAVISHEIRTPMSGIMGMVRLLLETSLTRDQKDYARTIQDSGDAMLALLNDILDFEKIETGKMDLEIIDFDLIRLTNDIMTLMSGHANQKGINLVSDIPDNVPRFVRGDPVRLRQVLLNLTGNAIKFTAEGNVTLKIHHHDDSGSQKQGWSRLHFSVQDSGIGISEEAQKNLFNPFSQADSSISRKYGGSGLGLAICQRLIEAMGGKISVNSTEGQGSTFFFDISMEIGQQDRIEESGSGASALRGSRKPDRILHILCVDDNEVNQKLLREFVSRMGHTPVLAGSGEEALDLIRQSDDLGQPFDMVLMDIQLPGISGMGATRAIRALSDPVKAALPVIALTGNVRDEDIRNCYAANMNGHLAKPIEPDKLRAQIDKVISGTLDNPVNLGDHDTVSAPGPATIVIDQSLIDAEFPDEDFTLDDDHGIDPPVKHEISALRAFALGEDATKSDPTPNIDDDDLDEDSFSIAMAYGTAQDALDNTQNGNTTDFPVFDDSMLRDLKHSMKPADLQDMIDSLLEKIDEILTALVLANDLADRDSLRARAHELKGMCGNFGLKEMSHVAANIEKAIRDNTADDLGNLIKSLPQSSNRARATLSQWITS